MKFKDIIGHNEIKKRLRQVILDNRISHAQMFLGAEGCGNLPLAIAYAQYVNCLNKKENDSCGECPSCKKMERLIHPDLHFSFPIAKGAAKQNEGSVKTKDPVSDNFIEEWRTTLLLNPYITLNTWLNILGLDNKQASIYKHESDEIIKKLSLKSFEAEYKILIMWMPEKMNDQAGNKLLKLIEEPPEKTLFLLVSENQDQILKTILSRTQIIKIPKVDDISLFDSLRLQHPNLKDQELWDIIKLANGSVSKALELIESSEETNYYFEKFTLLMRLAFGLKEMKDVFKWVDEIYSIGREKQKAFLIFASRLVRENFIKNFNNQEIIYLTEKEMDFAKKFSPYINERNIFLIDKEFKDAHYQIQRNVNAKLIFMDVMLKLNKLLKM